MHSLLELVFEHGSERVTIAILIKLELVTKLHNTLIEIYKNGVFLKELHVDSLILFIRRTVKLIENLQVIALRFLKMTKFK